MDQSGWLLTSRRMEPCTWRKVGKLSFALGTSQREGPSFFSYDGDETLWARFFDSDGDLVGCSFESSSSGAEDFHYKTEEANDEEVNLEDDN